jgi:hypothetical protein
VLDARRSRTVQPRYATRLAGVAVVVLVAVACGSDVRPAPTTPAASIGATSTLVATPGETPPVIIPSPPGRDFYAVPDPLSPGVAGSLVWAQPVAAPTGARAWRILYHSRSLQDIDIAVSGLVVAPDRPPPPGGWPVLAYAHGSTGLADRCAPSRSVEPIDATGADGSSFPVPPLWEQGFVVAATDYEGLGTPGRHPYVVGGSEARGVLDSVRAARLLPDVHAGDRTAVIGASQGGHAALFTGEIGPDYAPDVPLVGVVALAPASELARAARLLASDQDAVGFAVAIAAGFAAAYPDADLSSILTRAALRDIGVVDTGCLDDVVRTFSRPVEAVFRLERLLLPPWPGRLAENSPGGARTEAPIFVAQGAADALVVPELTDALVERLCGIGDTVTYRRYPGATHVGVADAAAGDIEAWLADRFAGVSPSAEPCPGA